jgi:DNA-binding CsgD family transcriptional regulator
MYQQKALEIAVARNDTPNQAFILRNISGIYRIKGDFTQAKAYALRAIDKGDRDTLKSLLNMAHIHYDYHEYDSAAIYVQQILQYGKADSAYTIPASVYYLLAKIAENENNYRRALEYTNQYHALLDEMRKKQEEQSLAGIKEQYELELAQAEKQIAEIHALWNQLLAFLIAVGAIIAVRRGTIGHRRYKKRFVKVKEDNDRQYNLRIDWVKKAKLIDQALNILKDEDVRNNLKDKIYKLLYNNNAWEALYAILNERHQGAMKRLQKQLSLPEQDFQICCFAYAGFSDKEMAACLQLGPNTIKSKKSNIRKQLKVSERGSIKKFMAQKLHNEKMTKVELKKKRLFEGMWMKNYFIDN